MKKTITALIICLALTMGTGIALAKNIACTVVQVEDNTVTLQCKSVDGLSEGDKVKVRTASKKAIEGC